MEITVISAQGLKNTSSSLFSRRLKPFVTLSLPPPTCQSNGYKPCHVYKTRVDDGGGVDPTWGDTFHIPIDHANFLCQKRPFVIYLQLYNSVLTGGQAELGWCQIPATDIVDGFLPSLGSIRHLSYRLRARDGSRGHGVVNVAVKLEGLVLPQMCPQRPPNCYLTHSSETGFGDQTVVGIPITTFPESRVKTHCNSTDITSSVMGGITTQKK